MTRLLALLAAVVLTGAFLFVGWRGAEQAVPGPAPRPRPGAEPTSPSPSTPPSPTEGATGSSAGTPTGSPTAAVLPPAPEEGACYRMDFEQAVAPTSTRRDVPCDQEHTAVTYAVGVLDTVVGGHLVTVDSARVRDQVSRTCPDLFGRHVGGSLEQRRLSMLRSVWFTPTLAQSDRGATWFRCDAIALAREGTLAPLGPRLRGVLSTREGRDRYGLCATAEPGTSESGRVACAEEHSWRAVRTVALGTGGGGYPGTSTVRDAGEQPCRAAGREASGGRLDFRWGYEWPTAAQWRAGQTYGLCWVPD